MAMSKKAISPVVATALLLVVAVVAVVGFQTWYNNYQSGITAKVEQQSSVGSSLNIERLATGDFDGNASDTDEQKVYVKNSLNSTVNATLYVDGTECGNITLNPSTVSNHVCNQGISTTAGELYEVSVSTTDGVYSEEKIVR